LARIDLGRGDVEAATARLRSMLKMPGAGVRPLLSLAKIAAREGRLREGASLLTKAGKLAPENLRIQLELIDMLGRLGDGDAALRNARKLGNRYIDNPTVMEKLGQVELAFGERADAAVAFRRMAGLIQDDADQILRVARYQLRAQDLVNAHDTLKRALVADASHLGVLETIIVLEARLKRFEDALFRTGQLIKRLPKRALGERLRGDVLVRMGRYRDAALAYRAAIGKQPSGLLHVRRHRALRNAGVESPSLTPLERWVEANPKDYGTRRALAAGYLRAKDKAAARRLYEALNRERPNDPVVLNNLAELYLDAGDDRALAFAEAAQRLAPKQVETLDTLGWIYVRRGRVEQGLTLLRDAFSRASRNATIRYHLAVALSQLGRIEEARAHLQDVLKAKNSGDVVTDAKRLLRKLEGG
jgi:putative PEP-CTERM system TPR-repeat lipoprotein